MLNDRMCPLGFFLIITHSFLQLLLLLLPLARYTVLVLLIFITATACQFVCAVRWRYWTSLIMTITVLMIRVGWTGVPADRCTIRVNFASVVLWRELDFGEGVGMMGRVRWGK